LKYTHKQLKIKSIKSQHYSKMMLAVSYADVIIVSQLRSAIALRYDATKHDTPIIVAKGVASVALQIKKIAIHNEIPIFQHSALVISLYNCRSPIPEVLYEIVAEVLTYAYTIKNQGMKVSQLMSPQQLNKYHLFVANNV